MEDSKIIELYFSRDEEAIAQTKEKYGKLLFGVSYGILHSMEDAEECVSDTYMRTWQSIPPAKPSYLSAFLSKIARNLSITKYRENKKRRNIILTEFIFEEMLECVPDNRCDAVDDIALRDALNGFLAGLDKNKRMIFVKRYFFMRSVKEIADEMGMKASTVKTTLSRTRVMLREYLEREGVNI